MIGFALWELVIASCMLLRPEAAEVSVLGLTAESPDEQSYLKTVFSGQRYWCLLKKREKTVKWVVGVHLSVLSQL